VANKDKTGVTNLYYSLNKGLTFESYQANIGEIKCLILGSLYAGASSGLWKLNTQPQILTYQVENPKVYAFPNPFNPKNGYTILKYFVPQGKKVDDLRVSIYNIAGELIYEFSDKEKLDGGYAYYYAWDGKNQNGNLCSRGVYIVVFKSNLGVVKTKVVLVK
ncbi:MAG: T9SS type A sorting domain-containing protein, partial [Endomicrobia bacterium]|nr:T9SS type A sorting domain-containing protein [Endomicrobiia bacterium]